MNLFAVCMSCALLHCMENTPVLAVRVCTCSHGQRTKYKQMQRASHNADAKQLSDTNPCEHRRKTWTRRLAIFISRIETTEKIRNKVEKWIGCDHLKVAILKSARSDFPIKTEHVQDGIQLNTYMGNYHQTHWFIPRASNTHTLHHTTPQHNTTHDNVS